MEQEQVEIVVLREQGKEKGRRKMAPLATRM